MSNFVISKTLQKVNLRALKKRFPFHFFLYPLFVNKELKLEVLKRIEDGLADLCRLAFSGMENVGDTRPLTTASGELPELVLKNIVTFRIHCLPKDYPVFSREVAKIFIAYAKLPSEEQTLLFPYADFVIIEGRVELRCLRARKRQPLLPDIPDWKMAKVVVKYGAENT